MLSWIAGTYWGKAACGMSALLVIMAPNGLVPAVSLLRVHALSPGSFSMFIPFCSGSRRLWTLSTLDNVQGFKPIPAESKSQLLQPPVLQTGISAPVLVPPQMGSSRPVSRMEEAPQEAGHPGALQPDGPRLG